VHLPTLTESFLAKDFDFAEYLAIQLGNAINEHFNMHFATLLCALPLLGACFLYVGSESQALYLAILDVSIDPAYIASAVLLGTYLVTLGFYFLVRVDLRHIQRALFPQIMLDEEELQKREYDALEEQCGGTPPPLVQPEGLILHQALVNTDMFSPYDELPLPNYLEQECLQEFENRVFNKCFANTETLATLSKHELLFGFTKTARHWNGGILQVV